MKALLVPANENSCQLELIAENEDERQELIARWTDGGIQYVSCEEWRLLAETLEKSETGDDNAS